MKTNRVSKMMMAALGVLALASLLVYAVPASAAAPAAVTAADTSLSTVETDDLVYMREEEKLAHDVYVTLYEQWDFPVFSNIASSESQHMDSIAVLLDRYGVADPAAGKRIGEFSDPTLQSLYDALVAQGGQSLAEALRVGATIEDLDIVDLQERIARTDNADVALVYESLMRGSRNHLRAFVSNLELETGETYEPQYLSAEEYQEIVDGSVERGGPAAGQGMGRRGRR